MESKKMGRRWGGGVVLPDGIFLNQKTQFGNIFGAVE
jgi:hypothetical protein